MAKQLSLQMSMTDSVGLREEMARCEAYAQAMADENARLLAQVKKLRKDNASWERSYKTLKADRDQIYQARLDDTAHPLHQECKRLRTEVDSLRLSMRNQIWRDLGMYPGSQPRDSVSREALTKLLTICHPDKVSHPEASALALAHEVTVMVTKMREGVRP